LTTPGAIVALAGRRIDARDAMAPRFPLENVTLVRQRIAAALEAAHACALVCAAACGADLIALQVAGAMGLRRIIVLALPAREFRDASVADRPGDWGPIFDRIMADMAAKETIIALPSAALDRAAAYRAANEAILGEAVRQGRLHNPARPVISLVVWDGVPHGDSDLSAHFLTVAQRLGIPVRTLSTL
jgi:hypothetical protein